MAAQQQAYVVPDDGNEDSCGACLHGGPLICCEGCPAAYHATCAGYATEEEVPEDEDWLCWSCCKQQRRRFLAPTTPLEARVGQLVYVASDDTAEVFYQTKVLGETADAYQLRYLDSALELTRETVPKASKRLWHGTIDPKAWVKVGSGAFRPAARAFAVDTRRVISQATSSGLGTSQARQSPSAVRTTLVESPSPGVAPARNPGPAPAASPAPQPVPLPHRVSTPAASRHTSSSPSGSVLRQSSSPESTPEEEESAPEEEEEASGEEWEPGQESSGGGGGGGDGGAEAMEVDEEPSAYAGGTAEVGTTTREEFMAALHAFWAARGKPLQLPIKFYLDKKLRLWELWDAVMSYGGYETVGLHSLWATVGRSTQSPPATCTTVSHVTKGAYGRYLLDFEQATRRGESGIPLPPATRQLPTSSRGPRPLSGRAAGGSRRTHTGGRRRAEEVWGVPPPRRRSMVYLPHLRRQQSASPGCEETAPIPKRVKLATPPPPPPPLSLPPAELVAGRVTAAEGGRLAPGDAVEVRSMAVGFRGAWFPAKVLEAAQGSAAEGGVRYWVEYLEFVVDEAHPDELMREWVPLVSRAIPGGAPVVLIRWLVAATRPLPSDAPLGTAVEAFWQGGWWMGATVGRSPAGDFEIRCAPEPLGEAETWAACPDQVRPAHPQAQEGFGMLQPAGAAAMMSKESIRQWLQPQEHSLEGFGIEAYACAEQLPSSYLPPEPPATPPPLNQPPPHSRGNGGNGSSGGDHHVDRSDGDQGNMGVGFGRPLSRTETAHPQAGSGSNAGGRWGKSGGVGAGGSADVFGLVAKRSAGAAWNTSGTLPAPVQHQTTLGSINRCTGSSASPAAGALARQPQDQPHSGGFGVPAATAAASAVQATSSTQLRSIEASAAVAPVILPHHPQTLSVHAKRGLLRARTAVQQIFSATAAPAAADPPVPPPPPPQQQRQQQRRQPAL